ncbi:cAMP phosphodiesterases class-II-domain-containing protein [Aspergillus cavernicola]|uniref:cAMP phosphodiesterases class-II-domain-containing protein n=1 Tax=Aspergillus cavernicola TaxID=176166 RepID=A0ABR4I8T6_9EURO
MVSNLQSAVGAFATADKDGEHSNGGGPTAMHVIVLGPTGGPLEDRVTGLLVRSLATNWAPNSVAAVDAGTLLSGIIHVLNECENKDGIISSGPFAGLQLPHKSTPANAAYIFQRIVGTVLITHPHLDHVSALAMNSPVLEMGYGPKTVAALPSVVGAIKAHVFNDVIWPNLSDEDGGAGLITYQRLVEGGNHMMGRGEARGYVQAGEGLLARCLSVSHGRCKANMDDNIYPDLLRRASSAILAGDRHRLSVGTPGTRTPSDALHSPFPSRELIWHTVDSSAFFIRDQDSGTEIIVFGDVEPDSLSLSPRNRKIWELAAPKIASRQLRAIFIECSYSDDIEDEFLFGHLCPRHLIEELGVLARFVADAKGLRFPTTGKRKRRSSGLGLTTEPLSPKSKRSALPSKSKSSSNQSPPCTRHSSAKGTDDAGELFDSPLPARALDPHALHRELKTAKGSLKEPTGAKHTAEIEMPLSDFSVYIIHVKDDMTDGPPPGEQILQELNEFGKTARLGCDFHVPKRGESIYV